MKKQGDSRYHFGTKCPEVAGLGSVPNKRFFTAGAVENSRSRPFVATDALLAV